MTPKLPVGKERSLITSESLPQKAEFRDFHLQTPNLSKQIPYTTDYFANFLQWPPVSKFLPVANWLVTWNLIFFGRPPKIGSKISSDAWRGWDTKPTFQEISRSCFLFCTQHTQQIPTSAGGQENGGCNWSPPWSRRQFFNPLRSRPNFLVEKLWHCGRGKRSLRFPGDEKMRHQTPG